MINVELSNPKINKLAHEMVARCMMHGPCGVTFPNAPCMKDGNANNNIHTSFNPRW
jgi:hypothetical protein